MSERPKGFDCQTCGKPREFPAYVYTHWDIQLVHDCAKCGARHSILRGEAKLIKAGKR